MKLNLSHATSNTSSNYTRIILETFFYVEHRQIIDDLSTTEFFLQLLQLNQVE